MRQKNFNNLIVGLVMALIVIGSLVVFSSPQSFSITPISLSSNNTVYTAQWLSVECIERSDSMRSFDLGSVDSSGEFFGCVSSFSNTYIPIGEECVFVLDRSGALELFTAYSCDSLVDEDDVKSDCSKEVGIFSSVDDKTTFNIPQGKYLFVNPAILSGVSVKAQYPSYGLKLETAEGRDFSTTESCFLESLPSGVQTVDLGSSYSVAPDIPFNAVTGLSPSISSRVVLLNDKLVFISNAGAYYDIITTDEGLKVVDTVSGVKFSSEIECIPGVLCSSDAKIITNLEDQDVSLIGGALSGYAPVIGDPTKNCKYEVVDGKLKVTNDCITVTSCTDPDKPLLDTTTGECSSFETTGSVDTSSKDKIIFWLILGAGAVFIVLIAVLVRVYSPSKKKKVVKRGRR